MRRASAPCCSTPGRPRNSALARVRRSASSTTGGKRRDGSTRGRRLHVRGGRAHGGPRRGSASSCPNTRGSRSPPTSPTGTRRSRSTSTKIRPRDEAYWERYRAAPKAFVPLAVGQELWGHRLGRVTSIRLRLRGGHASRGGARAFRDGAPRPARSRARGPRRRARSRPGHRRGAGVHGLRRVLRLLQLLPRGGGAPPRRPLLPPRRGAAPARDRPPPLGGLRQEGRAAAVPGGRPRALRGRRAAGHRVRLRLRRPRGPRAAHAVGGRGGNARALAPRLPGAARGGLRGRRAHGRVSPSPATLARTEAPLAAQPAERSDGGMGARRPDGVEPGPVLVLAVGATVLLVAAALGRLPAAGAFFGAGGLLLVAALLATAAFLRGRSRRPVQRLFGLGVRGRRSAPGAASSASPSSPPRRS